MLHIVGALIIGVLLGCSGLVPALVTGQIDNLVSWTLMLLMFTVGVGLGRDRQAIRSLLRLDYRLLLVPLLVGVGSIVASGALALGLGQQWSEGAALGAGLGWYSLSGVLIANIHSARLGALAFLANVMRETIGILIVPFVYRYFGDMAAVAPAGSTAMDVSLPVIIKVAGQQAGLVAFASGFILTMLVPVLIPLILR